MNLCRVKIFVDPNDEPEIRVSLSSCTAEWDADKQRGCRHYDDPNDPTGYCFQHRAGWCGSHDATKDATLCALSELTLALAATYTTVKESER